MEMEKSLSGNKTLNKLTLSGDRSVALPKQFCYHLLLGFRENKSLSEVDLYFSQESWCSADNGRLVPFLSVTYCVDVVYSV